MKAKLIKTGNDYLLRDMNGEVLAITNGTTEGRKLSKQNCNLLFGIYEPISDEDWKTIDGFSDYKISHIGNVMSCKFGKTKLMSQHIVKGGYKQVTLFGDNGTKRQFRVHQLVAKEFLGHILNRMNGVVDHIDGDKYNNNVSNLRIISQRINSTGRKSSSSKYRGVSFYKNYSKWCAKIYIDGKEKNLGYFLNEEDAAKAYQDALSKLEPQCFNNEIEVEIETTMRPVWGDESSMRATYVKKLDSSGCLILTKKI
jgi:hypothetical protein